MEPILVLLSIALVLWTVGCLIGLPIIAFLHSRRISRLTKQLQRLEEQLAQAGSAARPAAPEIPAAEPMPAATAASALEPPALPEVAPPAPLRPAGVALEAWIGRRGLGWVAVVLLLFATAFFLKQVFQNRWIGETGRVAIGVLAGVALCGAGLRYHLRGWRVFSQMATAGGIVLLYLSTFAAFGYYHLLPREHAAVFLVVLIAESGLLAVLYDPAIVAGTGHHAQRGRVPSARITFSLIPFSAIALMAMIGALLAPPLLRTEHDQYRSLFLYLAAVDLGALVLLVFRPWLFLGTLALLGTHVLFWGWYDFHYHPEKLVPAVCFQVGVFLLFLAYSVTAHLVRRRRTGVEDLIRLVLNAGLCFAALYTLLNDDYSVWMGSLAMVMAIIYAVLAAIVLRPDDRHFAVAAAVAMGFLATVFALQAEAVWICLGWAVEGLVLWWFGLRVRMPMLRGLGVVLLAMAVGRLLLVDTPGAHHEAFLPLLNRYGLPALGVAACVLGVVASSARFRQQLGWGDRAFSALAGLGGLILVGFVLSFETYDYFVVQINRQRGAYVEQPAPVARLSESRAPDDRRPNAGKSVAPGQVTVDPHGRPLYDVQAEEAVRLRRTAQTALSVVWAVYAASVLGLGFWLRKRAVRWMALALFAVTLGKVLLIDMAGLPGFYRVATLFALAVMMALAAWAYQRFQVSRGGDQGEVTEYDAD